MKYTKAFTIALMSVLVLTACSSQTNQTSTVSSSKEKTEVSTKTSLTTQSSNQTTETKKSSQATTSQITASSAVASSSDSFVAEGGTTVTETSPSVVAPVSAAETNEANTEVTTPSSEQTVTTPASSTGGITVKDDGTNGGAGVFRPSLMTYRGDLPIYTSPSRKAGVSYLRKGASDKDISIYVDDYFESEGENWFRTPGVDGTPEYFTYDDWHKPYELPSGRDTNTTTDTTIADVTREPTTSGGLVTYSFTKRSEIRTSPSLSGAIVNYFDPGHSVRYDSTVVAEGHTWISYISYGGNRYYVAID